MSDRKVTSLEVAARAGVSQSAVSRVFTRGASVSTRTREKVKSAAAELGYRPNAVARSLITGRSGLVGVVVTYLENQFYPSVLESLSRTLQLEGYRVLMFLAPNHEDNIDPTLEDILDHQVDGLVLADTALSSQLASRCRQSGIPVVLFNRTQYEDDVCSVAANNTEGGRQVAELLASAGYQRIAYLAGWQQASTQREREQGFLAGLESAGLELHARDCGEFDYARAQAATRRLMEKSPDIDALFVCNDHMAFAAMDVLRSELGVSIPDDVAVVGFDDVPMASWPAFDLTTVRQPADAMAKATVEALLEQISDPKAAAGQLTLDAPLIVRGSVATKSSRKIGAIQ